MDTNINQQIVSIKISEHDTFQALIRSKFFFSLLELFADNTKCYKNIADIMDSTQLQGDLNLLNT